MEGISSDTIQITDDTESTKVSWDGGGSYFIYYFSDVCLEWCRVRIKGIPQAFKALYLRKWNNASLSLQDIRAWQMILYYLSGITSRTRNKNTEEADWDGESLWTLAWKKSWKAISMSDDPPELNTIWRIVSWFWRWTLNIYIQMDLNEKFRFIFFWFIIKKSWNGSRITQPGTQLPLRQRVTGYNYESQSQSQSKKWIYKPSLYTT